MRSDLRSTLHRLAPSPKRNLDISFLVREGKRRRRTRYVAYTAAALAVTVVAAIAIPAVVSNDVADRNRGPAQAPTDDATSSPDSTVAVPVFENLKQGWTKLAPPPEPRTEAVTVWSGRTSSGRDLVVWGGYTDYEAAVHNDGFSWDPETNDWAAIAESPLSGRGEAGAVFTGSEIVIWGGYGKGQTALGDGAAYDPEADRWRMLPDAPIAPAIPVATVWTGEEVIIWGSIDRSAGSREGAAYNPNTNEWRRLPEAPAAINLGTAVWTSGDPSRPQEMIVFGAQLDDNNASKLDHAVGIAYDPSSDSWRELPNVDLVPQASAIAWTGDRVIAWDYALSTAEYDPVSNRWRDLPRVPLQDSECYPATETIGSYVFAWFCGQAALWDLTDQRWDQISTPKQVVPGTPVAAGEVLLFAGATHESGHNSLWIYAPPGDGD
jgi:hypothetical protein